MNVRISVLLIVALFWIPGCANKSPKSTKSDEKSKSSEKSSKSIAKRKSDNGGKRSRPKVHKVYGIVMYKGKPVADAVVTFHASNGPRAATGITDAEGRFRLTTFDAYDGAVAGEHKVTISKTSGDHGKDIPAKDLSDPTKLADAVKNSRKSVLPLKYAKLNTTPLKATVEVDHEVTFVFQLVD